jgi:ATP-dependent RNA helicase DDX35
VAATSVATRVAEEVGCALGGEVGYSIRFEDVTSEKTKIKFLTDGLLLREALVDPLLSRYSVIMVDEAHERSLSSDILLGLLKKIRKRRPELRIIVSSATLQAEDFLRFFTGSDGPVNLGGDIGTIFYLGGRMYPVDIHYLEEPAEDYVEAAISTIFTIHSQEAPGDILLFLTGREEIETAHQMIADRALDLHPQAPALLPLPLYAGLPTEQQLFVFDPAPANTRKVILATNIAEASITIDGIIYVIDTGYVKLRAYNPLTGISTLTRVPVSQASATQRAGRAGRTKPGKCYRLYSSTVYASLPIATPPEIQRADLAPVILQLKALGVDNIARFDFLTAPPAELIIRALELLYSLGALDTYSKLTHPLGLRMAELAIEPMLAKALLSSTSPETGCLSEMLTVAAMLSLGSNGSVWFSHEGEQKAMDSSRRKFAAEEGDAVTLLNVYQAFVTIGRKDARWCQQHHLNFKSMSRAVSIRNQLRRYLERFGIEVTETLAAKDRERGMPLRVGGAASLPEKDKGEMVRRCLTMGYFAQAARMQPDGTFRTVNGAVMHAHPSSLMFVSIAAFLSL